MDRSLELFKGKKDVLRIRVGLAGSQLCDLTKFPILVAQNLFMVIQSIPSSARQQLRILRLRQQNQKSGEQMFLLRAVSKYSAM